MNLGVILAIGESLSDLKSKGQLKRLLDYNIKKYSKAFDQVFIFSYENEKNYKLPKNCQLIANTLSIHRYPYSILMPIIKRKEIKKCHVLRGLQLSGGIPAAVAKVIYGKRFVVNYGYDYSKFAKIENKIIRSLLYKIIEIPILHLADKIIITSTEIKKSLSKKFESKLTLIQNGVDTKLFRTYPERKSKDLTIMFIGRIEPQKNLKSLILALAGIPKAKAIFFGEGSQKRELPVLAKKVKVNLQIKSSIDYEKIPKTLARADIFVLPSYQEGNPKILLEAMSCGKAVIGTDVAGTREIIQNGTNGLLTSTSSQSIRKAIKKLKNSDLREKLGKAAREFIIENYDIRDLLTREVKLLERIAK